jgi:hypothetical protein
MSGQDKLRLGSEGDDGFHGGATVVSVASGEPPVECGLGDSRAARKPVKLEFAQPALYTSRLGIFARPRGEAELMW